MSNYLTSVIKNTTKPIVSRDAMKNVLLIYFKE